MTHFVSQTWPNPEEKRKIKAEICALEKAKKEALALLEKTQCRVDDLTKRLFEARLRIAPIKMLTFDVLSMIFEFCARNDWRSPLLLGSICRGWRATVLQTPRAWRFINQRYCSKTLAYIYAERSQRCALHINLPAFSARECIKPIAHQVHCMRLHASAPKILKVNFANLARLEIARWRRQSIDASLISASQFPSLRDLQVDTVPLSASGLLSFPPLERLSTMVDVNEVGLNIINACAASLKSLHMHIVTEGFASTSLTLKLPQLSHFKIRDSHSSGHQKRLILLAPRLSSYIEDNGTDAYVDTLNNCVESISHLRIHRPPPSLPTLKRLRVLQLRVTIEHIRIFLSDLVLNKSIWSRLKHIEFLSSWMKASEIDGAKSMINGFRDSYKCDTLPSVQLVCNWCLEIPQEGVAMCQDDFPCYSWKEQV
ncbi:hypothetical protein M408DRAFT_24782 [Serendipita vermifera MAFF 305830]|uniref:F-box domain-containing protein n=1 Tax=Serendipita vermifera MAFF 305830 TaxID=933852 RepID=A0A0C3B6D9_SERVB|nr:hypothetical protein M408DRAFT_24782 [Serendipita vermifera MAFF 305830]